MAQRSCCVPGCAVKRSDGVLLHCFPNPSNPNKLEVFRTWIMKIGGDIIGEDDSFIYRNRKVCHKHFEDKYMYPNKKLMPIAIPTLQMPGIYISKPKNITASAILSNIEGPSTSADAKSATLHTGEIGNVGRKALNVQFCIEPEHKNTDCPSTSTAVCYSSSTKTEPTRYRKPMTATEKQLRDIVTETKLKLRKCKSVKQKLETKNKMAGKLLKCFAYQSLKERMTPAARTFFNMQIKQSNKKPTGRRFTLDEKILCLSIYKPCPKAYRQLSRFCILPKRKTLDKIISKIKLNSGINDLIFEHLKKRVDEMPDRHKFCCLIFDEMAIAPNLTYDKNSDTIHGFVDNGEQRQRDFSDHVLVLMVRGVLKKFKQPVSFTFCRGSTKSCDLAKLIKNVIVKLTNCGLKIVATVCDQGSSNVAAMNSLLYETKAKYLRNNKTYRGGFFELGSNKIYVIYDPPHLLKGIRNNLLQKDLQFTEEEKPKTASWSHIEALYRRGPGYRGVRLVKKLTAQHVIPNMIPKMRVKHCTQVFSDSVGRTMGYMADEGKLPNGSQDTADLLLFFDQLFDSVNGNFSKPECGSKIYRSAVTPSSPHFKLWYSSLRVLKSMKFINKKSQGSSAIYNKLDKNH